MFRVFHKTTCVSAFGLKCDHGDGDGLTTRRRAESLYGLEPFLLCSESDHVSSKLYEVLEGVRAWGCLPCRSVYFRLTDW